MWTLTDTRSDSVSVRKAGVFPLENVRQRKNSSSSMKLDVRLKNIRSFIALKDAIAKNFVANEHQSFTFVFTFSVVVVDYRPTAS